METKLGSFGWGLVSKFQIKVCMFEEFQLGIKRIQLIQKLDTIGRLAFLKQSEIRRAFV